MKIVTQKFNLFTLSCLLCALLLFILNSCNEDEAPTTIQEKKFTVKKQTLAQTRHYKALQEQIPHINTTLTVTAKNSFTHNAHLLTVDTTSITYIEDQEGYYTYTFALRRYPA